MPEIQNQSGFATLNHAHIYYEMAGEGQPFIMIHAGIADSRQWNNEFAYFSKRFRVVRYDLRGYGKSEPVEGEFSHLQDMAALLDYLNRYYADISYNNFNGNATYDTFHDRDFYSVVVGMNF